MKDLSSVVEQARACRLCEGSLPQGPRPVLRASVESRILLVGQAPGTKVHATGIPWNDASGERLRGWLGVDRDQFYNEKIFAIIPMGLCYPGRGKSGDLPPRKECAPLWHPPLRALLPNLQLTLLIGQYAQVYYLGDRRQRTLTETVRHWRDYWPEFLPLVHPSPRNEFWLQRNPWFEAEIIPEVRQRVADITGL